MELIEFVKLDASQIRKDKELMQLFVKFYEAAFSFTPKCAGCSFKSGFKKLRKHVLSGEKNIIFDKTITIMETNKTFILKSEFKTKILTYKKDGVTYRKYGNLLTEEFAKELVKHGKTEVFAKLPSVTGVKANQKNEDDEIKELEGLSKKGSNQGEELIFDKVKTSKDDSISTENIQKKFVEHVVEKIKDNAKKDFDETFVKYEDMHHQKELLPLYTEVKERTGKKALSNRKADIIAFLIENEA